MNEPLHRFKAEFFKALAHPARIKILEILRWGEQTVSELQAQLEIDPSSVSQHLGVLRNRQILDGRKVGTSVYYRVVDPQVLVILDAAREIFETHVEGLPGVLVAQREEDDALAAGSRVGPAGASGARRVGGVDMTNRTSATGATNAVPVGAAS